VTTGGAGDGSDGLQKRTVLEGLDLLMRSVDRLQDAVGQVLDANVKGQNTMLRVRHLLLPEEDVRCLDSSGILSPASCLRIQMPSGLNYLDRMATKYRLIVANPAGVEFNYHRNLMSPKITIHLPQGTQFSARVYAEQKVYILDDFTSGDG
jgi:hypothetical protein